MNTKATHRTCSPLTRISDLALSTRTQNALYACGYARVADLTNVSEAELLLLTGIGRGVIAEVRSALANCDISLRGDAL